MKKTVRSVLPAVVCFLTLAASAGWAKPSQAEHSGSPYFLVRGGEKGVDALPLKSTSASVNIAGVIADVTLVQEYRNEGEQPIEAVYVFPASTRAAVHNMKMTIGERTIVARIERREEARETYEAAKAQGKRASLLEQHRPNVFQMSVANILPGDLIRVALQYTELLVPKNKQYEFVVPTVVGPRYEGAAEGDQDSGSNWNQNPYLEENQPPPYRFDLSVSLSTGLPIQKISCPSHDTQIRYQGPELATVTLAPSETRCGNRDFILKYQLAGGEIETGLLLYKGEKENFFLLMVQPPERVTPSEIPARETIFVVDVSGSMHGFPLDVSKALLRDLIQGLRPSDTFNVLLFAGGSALLSERSLPACRKNVEKAVRFIDRQSGGGGTRILPALQRALALPREEDVARSIVVVTDGYVSVEAECFDLIRDNLGKANLFAFGIGSSVNRHLIQGMARVGMGEPFVVTNANEADRIAGEFRRFIAAPVLTDISVRFQDFAAYDAEPPAIPDVLADRPVVVFGKWRGTPDGSIRIQGTGGKGAFTRTIDVAGMRPLAQNAALRYLWARHRIALLSDYERLEGDPDRVAEMTRLGLEYNLLTAHTAFVAVDSEIANKAGNPATIRQPLPLPQGVSHRAVAGRQAKTLSETFLSAAPPQGSLQREIIRQGGPGRQPPVPASPAASTVNLKEVRCTGAISHAAVRRAVKAAWKEFQACFSSPASMDPSASLEITLKMNIDEHGKAVWLEPKKASNISSKTWRCLKEWIQTVAFPAAPSGQTAEAVLVLAIS
jgi:Ca-activated chloride channel family protein